MDFYGDNTRWFIGTVIARDPEHRGRFKIRIAGIHSDNVNDKFLPYAETLLPSTEGGVSGLGRIPQLENTALVFGIFLDGKNSQSPLILGSITHGEFPSSVQKNTINESGASSGEIKYRPPESKNNGTSTAVVKVSSDIVSSYANGNADVDTRRMIVMKYLLDNGLSVVAAAGVTGNIEWESAGFNPEAHFKTDKEDSWGLAQWNDKTGNSTTPSRLQQLKNYAAENFGDWKDFIIQLQFLVVDMKTNSWQRHRVWNHLNDRSKTLTFDGGKVESNATYFFLHNYEIGDESSLGEREKNALKAYNQWNKSIVESVRNSRKL